MCITKDLGSTGMHFALSGVEAIIMMKGDETHVVYLKVNNCCHVAPGSINPPTLPVRG